MFTQIGGKAIRTSRLDKVSAIDYRLQTKRAVLKFSDKEHPEEINLECSVEEAAEAVRAAVEAGRHQQL